MKAAVFPARMSQELPEPASAHRSADPSGMGFADAGQLPRAVSGTVLDVSPQVLVLGDETDTQRFTLTPDVATWRGGRLDPAALRPGDHAVLRLRTSSRHTIDRIWANIGRVTGVILQRSGGTHAACLEQQQIDLDHRARCGKVTNVSCEKDVVCRGGGGETRGIAKRRPAGPSQGSRSVIGGS